MPRVFVTIVLIMGSAVAGFFYLSPAWKQFSETRSETAALSEASSELDDLIANRDTLLQAINAVSKENLDKIDRALPQGANSSEFLVLLELLAKANRLDLKRVDLASTQELKIGSQPKPGGSVKTPGNTGTVKDFPFTIQVAGSYEGIKGFLKSAEQSLRLIDIQGVNFSAPSKQSDFDVTVKAKAYYQ